MINEYIALDVETTGLNPARDKLLEIGAVRVQNGVICATYVTLVDGGTEVPERIEELTGITDAMRRTGKKTAEAIREFLEFRGSLPVVGHNVSFDYGFLKQAAINEGCAFETEALDTLKIARRVLPGLPSRALTAMCAYYQLIRAAPIGHWMMRNQHICFSGDCGRTLRDRSGGIFTLSSCVYGKKTMSDYKFAETVLE